MSDSFSVLKDALEPLFHLESMRNGKYIYPVIPRLKYALENYQPHNKRSFIELHNAIIAARPNIEKWHIDFDTIKTAADSLAKTFKLPIGQWGGTYSSHSDKSPKFQFGALNHIPQNAELLAWLAAKADPTVSTTIGRLVKFRDHFGFSTKLSAHLQKDPDFLFRLIMESANNFSLITGTRLILHLTDKQLAEAIIKHIPNFVENNPDPLEQATILVGKLNEILSNGRSVSTLLRNAEAKPILDSSEHLQTYLNEVTGKELGATSINPPSSSEEGGLKPGI